MLDKSYRVYQASEKTKFILRSHREATGESNELALATAVDQQLPRIVETLIELGFSKESEPKGPVRRPISDLVLGELREASEATGLPQSQLLLLSLLAHCSKAQNGTPVAPVAKEAPAPAPAKKRAGRAEKEAATTTSKKAAPAKPATRRGRKAVQA